MNAGDAMFTQDPRNYPDYPLLARLKGREKVEAILNQGEPYIDDEFPHNDQSIFDQERGVDDKLEGMEWRSAREVFGSYEVLPENDDEITPDAIKQGLLGDCYYLSGLAALAEWPQRVRDLFVTDKPTPSGAYIVRLYLNGEFKEITLD